MTSYDVRRVAAEDWPRVRDLRLEALRDEVAAMAFLDTHQEALERPDSYWQDRAARAATGASVAQYVAITDVGQWVGSVTGLREEPGTDDWAGHPIEQLQVHVVGVWLHPDHRGAGLLARLFEELERWAAAEGMHRFRLLVHEGNTRARAAYRKLGFETTGAIVPLRGGNEVEMTLRRS
jgi:RimJ/RimL family protein N-acetyltransferase